MLEPSALSTAPVGSTRSRAWLLAALGVVLFWAIPNLRYPIGRDQATYCVVGEGLLHGHLPYRDLWDNKPPGIFYIYALIVKAFGPVMWCVGVVDVLWLLAISCCIFFFVRRYLGAPAAALSMVFYATKHCRQGYVHAAQPETFMVLCIFGACLLLGGREPSPVPQLADALSPGRGQRRTLWEARCLAAGLALGAAFWLKYNAVFFFPVVAFLPYLELSELDRKPPVVKLSISWRDWFRRVVVLTVGFLACVGGVLAYLWLAGLWPAFREEQFEVMPRYGATVFHWNLLFVEHALTLTRIHIGPWTMGIAALALLIAWRSRELGLVAPALFMAWAGFVAVAMQGRFHPYYFEACYPFLAMFWGYVCVKAYQAFRFGLALAAKRGWRLAGVVLWILLANLAFALLPEECIRLKQNYQLLAFWRRNPELSYAQYWWQLPLEKLHDQMQIIDYLKDNSRPGDQVFVWGTAPLINFLTGRRSPSRFVSNLGLISTWGPDRWRQELVRDLQRARPRFVVVARHDEISTVSGTWRDSEEYLQVYPALAGLLHADYRSAENLPDFEIYRLKDE